MFSGSTVNLDLRHLSDDDGSTLPPAFSAPAPLRCPDYHGDKAYRSRVWGRLLMVALGLGVLVVTVLMSGVFH
jgi:hypothetical protein